MRTAGVLMPLFSLPSSHGIGTLGETAFRFVDFLAGAGQSVWQMLPIGPTGYGDSPYQSFSVMAGNPYYIDLDWLVKDGLLKADEIGTEWGRYPYAVDYERLFEKRFDVLQKATERLNTASSGYKLFHRENKDWLDDYALFMALKEQYGHKHHRRWPKKLRQRNGAALQQAREKLAPRIAFWQRVQYLFFAQWNTLKKYANQKGIALFGDLPIYASPDSSDLWAHPDLFITDKRGRPVVVAGVPPDGYAKDGQLWGNPLYDWPLHKETDYRWWLARLAQADRLYDITRIDHFRGFAGFYAVGAGDKTARRGKWHDGPGTDFIDAVQTALPALSIVAEDLGHLTDDVHELLAYSGWPGMNVLHFAFDTGGESSYLPHLYKQNAVVYTGTHDNHTTEGWQRTMPQDEAVFARRYLGLQRTDPLTDPLVRTALASVCDTAIIPLQDWLHLGDKARINTPSTLGGSNWRWRLVPNQLTHRLALRMKEQTDLYGRLSPACARQKKERQEMTEHKKRHCR